MPNHVTSNNDNEERRNKILRARYGLLKLNTKCNKGSPLFVVGQTMAGRNNGVNHASQIEYFNQIRKNPQALAGLRRTLTPLGVTISTIDDFRLVASGIQLPHYNQHSNENFCQKTYQSSPALRSGRVAVEYKDAPHYTDQSQHHVSNVRQKAMTSPRSTYHSHHETFASAMQHKGKFVEEFLNKAQIVEKRRGSAPSPTATKAPQSSPTLYREEDQKFLKQDAPISENADKNSPNMKGRAHTSASRGVVVIPSAENVYDKDFDNREGKCPKATISGGDVGNIRHELSEQEIKFKQAYESSYTKSVEGQKSSTEVYKAYERLSSMSTTTEKKSRSQQRRSASPQFEKDKITKRNGTTPPQKHTSSPRNKIALKKAGSGKSCPALGSDGSKVMPDKTNKLPKTTNRNKSKRGSRSKQGNADVNKQTDKTKPKMISVKQSIPKKPSETDLQELELANTRRFMNMPKSRPKAVCFDVEGVDITHMDIKRAVEIVLPDAYVTGTVTKVQFENTNVKLGTSGCKNRWIIELKDFMTRNKLIKNGLSLNYFVNHKIREEDGSYKRTLHRKKVDIKLYDMTTMEEYKLYLRRNACEEKLQSVILMSAGRHGQLLTNML